MPLILNGDGSVGPLSATEIGYLDGITSAVQGQINSKAPIDNPTFTGVSTIPTMRTSSYYTKRSASFRGYGNQSYSFNFSTSVGDSMVLITAAGAHYGSSGHYCIRQSYLGFTPGVFEINAFNSTSNIIGNWSFTWSSGNITVTKTAGTYVGEAYFWITVEGSGQ